MSELEQKPKKMDGEIHTEKLFLQEKGDNNTNHADDKTPLPVMTRMTIIKNIVVLSVSFMFLFTAFQSLQNLQSSLNKEEGLGTVSLSVIYVASMVAGLFLPPLIINRLGCKWTLVASIVCYIVFMGANLYPVWGTMIPASIIIGIGAAPLWAAKCTYLTQTGIWYAKLTNSSKDGTISVFFGVFFMTFQTSQIWGNLISSLVFSEQIPEVVNISSGVLSRCGANYCPDDYQNNTNLDRPDMTKIYTVCGTYLGSAVMALLIIILLLDKIVLDNNDQKEVKELVTSIARHFIDSRYQKLLIPLTVYSGVEQAFIAGDFTRSFISCSIGVWNVGFVMIAYGVADALSSFTVGRLVQYTSFLPWFILVFILHGGSLIAFLMWTPSGDHLFMFYVFAVIWGIGDAIIQTLINALYGYHFTTKPEAAFASYRLCESAGFILAFGYSSYVCTYVKIYVSLALLTFGTCSYFVVEILHRQQRSRLV